MPGSSEQNAWVSRVLGLSAGGESETDEEEFGEDFEELGLDVSDVWRAARRAFDVATESVDAQIKALQSELRESEDYQLEEIAEYGLNGLTNNTRVPLIAALLESGDGSKKQLQTAGPKIEKAAQTFITQLNSDPRVAACDQNPFGIELAIAVTYQDAVDQLLNAVRAAAQRK
jgi:hypothetical protein